MPQRHSTSKPTPHRRIREASPPRPPRPQGIHPLYETGLGYAAVADALPFIRGLPEASIDLAITSPPFALKRKKEYGNVDADAYCDWFMPFAPSCLEDKGHLYFKNFTSTPFMTLAFDVVEGKESDISAAIHVDNTARVHSVRPDNPLYYETISKFYEKTGVPVILNTSFNKHGLPIVHRPSEAIEHLIWGCVHELAIGGYIVRLK